MEEQFCAKRAQLRQVLREHPTYSNRQLAQAVECSMTWVKKWKKRLREADPQDERVLWSRSTARKTPQPKPTRDPIIVERLLEIRDHPPDNLQRVPGPKTISYFLNKDQVLKDLKLVPPTSTSTIWEILVENGRISHPAPHMPKPRSPEEPYTCWQMDFKDSSTVEVEPGGKKQHVVEVLDVVDEGSSASLMNQVRGDYNSQTVLIEMKTLIEEWGLPQKLTIDRDPRFVGSASGRDFPSAFVKFWTCLDVELNICPPHRPDLNCYVERFHRSLGSECLSIHRPADESETRDLVDQYKYHYNYERPHQGATCKNQPPMVAFPPPVHRQPPPFFINPDSWLYRIDGRRYARKVGMNGTVIVANHLYYVGTVYAKQYVALVVDAKSKQFSVQQKDKELLRVKIKGLYNGQEVTFAQYHEMMVEEAGREKGKRTFYVSPSGETNLSS